MIYSLKKICNRELQQILFVVALLSSIIESDSATINKIPIIIFCFYVFTFNSFFQDKRFYYLLGILILLVLSILSDGFLIAKDLFLYFVPFVVLRFIVSEGGFDYRSLYIFVAFTIIWYLLKNPTTVSYFPNNMMINVYGQGTKHGTAFLGTLLFLVAAYACYFRWKLTASINVFDVINLFLGLYLVLFSTSRSALLALLATIMMLVVNRNKYKKWLTWLIFLLFNMSTFLLESLSLILPQLNDIPFFSDFIHVDNFERYGVTSGRAWLWQYHLNIFLNHPFWGGGRNSIDFFVGDTIGPMGEIAPAGSESPFTGYLACSGMIGLIQILLPIMLFAWAVKRENIMGSSIMFCCVYNTVMGTNYFNFVGGHILIIALFFMSFYDNRFVKQKRIKTWIIKQILSRNRGT